MSGDGKVSVFFAKNEMKAHSDKIRRWGNQNNNSLLKECADAVLEAAGEK